MKQNIIAVDFDGTLCENKWPEIGIPNEELIEYLKKRQANGEKLILWTNRVGDRLDEAVKWSAEKGLIFDAVNDNLPEIVEAFGTNCRKIFANEYIDDRNRSIGSCREKEFTLDDFSCEHIHIRQSTDVLKETIDALNVFRDVYLNGGILSYENGNQRCYGKNDKEIWWQMIQLLPSSYNQTRNVMMNYEVLANIYKSRKDHKLNEWRNFCKWIETLPYSELIAGKTEED